MWYDKLGKFTLIYNDDNKNNEGNKNNNILSDEVNINKMKESSTLVLNDVVIIARCEDSFINAT